jgi:hypothetical protein
MDPMELSVLQNASLFSTYERSVWHTMPNEQVSSKWRYATWQNLAS